MKVTSIQGYMPWGQSKEDYARECIQILKTNNSISFTSNGDLDAIHKRVINAIFERLERQEYKLKKEIIVYDYNKKSDIRETINIEIVRKPVSLGFKVLNIKEFNLFYHYK